MVKRQAENCELETPSRKRVKREKSEGPGYHDSDDEKEAEVDASDWDDDEDFFEELEVRRVCIR